MLLAELVATSAAVAATSGRRAKIELIAGALRRLAPDEIAAGAAYLAGELRQRQIGVGWASLRDLPPPAPVACPVSALPARRWLARRVDWRRWPRGLRPP